MSAVSVIIPARNASATIAATLRSLQSDTRHILEILLIDDGSTDQTVRMARDTAEKSGLPLTVHTVSAGSAGAARNAGLNNARGTFGYFIDADDLLAPGGIGRLLDLFETEPDAVLAIGASVRISAGYRENIRIPSDYTDDPVKNAELYLGNERPPISVGSALFRMSAVDTIRFPETIGLDEDTWFWTALLAAGPVKWTDSVVLNYHLDQQRTARRYLVQPLETWTLISECFRQFEKRGLSAETLAWRRAWLAQRFARQLVKHGRFAEAEDLLAEVRKHPRLRREWRTWRYEFATAVGRWRTARHPRPPRARNGEQHRTLVLTYDPAWPPVSGADLRNFANAQACASLGPTQLVSVRPLDRDAIPAHQIEVATLTRPGEARRPTVNRLRAMNEPRISKAAARRLMERVAEFGPDTVIVEGIGLQSVIEPLRSVVPQLILDMHNVESELAAQAVAVRTPRFRFKIWLLRRQENRAVACADRVWTCTGEDRDRILARRPVTPVHVVPNTVPRFDEIAPGAGYFNPASERPVILFVGHLGYWPNIDAAKRLALRILPLVRKAIPQTELILAGRHPKSEVRRLADIEGVEVNANPADLSPLFDRADMTIVPLTSGGGSRIKILEAIARKKPIVATPLAVEGLALDDGAHLLLGSTDEDLAAQAIRLANDIGLRERLAESAYAFIRDRNGPDAHAAAVQAGLGFGATSESGPG